MDLALVVLAVVANVLAVASVLALAQTVDEMRRQRMSAYVPDLFFAAGVAHVAWSWDSRYPLWVAAHPITDDHVAQFRELASPYITCLNLGAGPAKRVAGTWEFESAEFGRLVRLHRGASISYADNYISAVTRLGRQLKSQTLLGLTANIVVPFITPSSGGAESAARIPLPLAYLNLAAAAAAVTGDGVFSATLTLPELRLHINYEDREGNRHQRSYFFTAQASCPTSHITEGKGIGAAVQIKSVRETVPKAA